MARTALRCCFLSKALVVRSVAAGKKSRGRAGASWALLCRAPSSRPGFTLLSRTEQTHSQPCSSVRGLAWHSMPITISWRREGFAFCSGAQADSVSRPVPSPQERRGDRIPAQCPSTGMGNGGDCLHSFPGTPPATHNAATSWWKTAMTDRFSMGLFLRVPGMASGGKPKCALGTGGLGDAVPLVPEAQDRPAFCPDSFLRVEHAPLP